MDPEDREHFKKIQEALLQPASGSLSQASVGNSALTPSPSRPSQNTFHLKKATAIYQCYPKSEGDAPDVFIAAVAAVLSMYPDHVVNHVCDPRTGIVGKSKWRPVIAEIREACEAEMVPIYREIEYQRSREWTRREEAKIAALQREERPTYEELQRRCAAVGINIGKRQSVALTEEQKKAALVSAAEIGKSMIGMKLGPEALKTIEASRDEEADR